MADILQHPTSKFKKYFRDRGLTEEDVANLGAKHLTGEDLIAALPGNGYMANWTANGGTGALIPYIDINGQPTDWYVVRLLGTFPGFSKMPKAFMPPKRRPRAHFPRGNDPMREGEIVYLCESILKAEIVSKCGYYAIGINGCRGFSDRNTTELLMPDLRDLPWEIVGEVRVFFDSNYSTNDQVKAAASQFALRCEQVLNFKRIGITILPPPEGKQQDWGCDDAAVAMGRSWLCDVLDEDPIKPELNAQDIMLMDMNDQVCVVQETGMVMRYDTYPIIPMTAGKFYGVNYADWLVMGEVNGKPKVVSVARKWLTWKGRHAVIRMDMKPNCPRIVEGEYLNIWKDPEIVPGEPSKIWAEFMENMIQDPDIRRWMDQWIAYLIQNPGEKMNCYPLLFGPQGVGKSLMAEIIIAMLGVENCAALGQEDLESHFTGLHAIKLFTVINEFYTRDTGVGNKLKKMVTETTTVAKFKYGPEFMVKSTCNYMITTNDINALKMDEDDRRTGVVDCTPLVDRSNDDQYFGPLWALVQEPGSVLGYYMEMDMSGFSPTARPPYTSIKALMTESRRNVYEQLAQEIHDDPALFFESVGLGAETRFFSVAGLMKLPYVRESLGIGELNGPKPNTIKRNLHSAFKKRHMVEWEFPVGTATKMIQITTLRHVPYCVRVKDRTANIKDVKSDLKREPKKKF